MTARARAPKTEPTPLGESIRAYATQYLSSGQKERARGLAQAAMVVDDWFARDVPLFGLTRHFVQRWKEENRA